MRFVLIKLRRMAGWIASNIKLLLTFVMIYISVAGLFTFSLFILEESFQTVMFGTWPAQDAKRWDVVKVGISLMKRISKTGKIVTWFSIIQPLGFVSYRMYFKSSDYYVQALEAKCLANAPELFIGERITVNFTPKNLQKTASNQWKASAGKVSVIYDKNPGFKSMTITGTLNEKLEIQQEETSP